MLTGSGYPRSSEESTENRTIPAKQPSSPTAPPGWRRCDRLTPEELKKRQEDGKWEERNGERDTVACRICGILRACLGSEGEHNHLLDDHNLTVPKYHSHCQSQGWGTPPIASLKMRERWALKEAKNKLRLATDSQYRKHVAGQRRVRRQRKLSEAEKRRRVRCPIPYCGEWHRSLGIHLRAVHDMSVAECNIAYPNAHIMAPDLAANLRIRNLRKELARGFVKEEQYDVLAREAGKIALWLRAMVEVAYIFGLRKSELLKMRVCQVANGTIVLKSSELVKMKGNVSDLLQQCVAGKGPADFVFTRKCDWSGRRRPRIYAVDHATFRKAWDRARVAAGCPGLLFDDLRRTAVRNMIRSGISETNVMRITGSKSHTLVDSVLSVGIRNKGGRSKGMGKDTQEEARQLLARIEEWERKKNTKKGAVVFAAREVYGSTVDSRRAVQRANKTLQKYKKILGTKPAA